MIWEVDKGLKEKAWYTIRNTLLFMKIYAHIYAVHVCINNMYIKSIYFT